MSGTNDYIRTFGQTVVLNTFYKYAILILGIIALAEGFVLISVFSKASEVKVLPIYIDRDSGSARPIDYQSIDASGEKRIQPEIVDFCNTYINNLYTFNRFTLKASLELVFTWSTPEVAQKLKYYLSETNRANYINSSDQGLCKVSYTDLVSVAPEMKIQVAFRRSILDEKAAEKSSENMVAIMKLKTIKRSVSNSHGLIVYDYRESQIKEFTDEK